jgi:SAM-dependent methyltransferase
MMACSICGASVGSHHDVREMMLGSRRSYRYWLCAACGCMQLRDAVTAAEQYPPRYYSFHPQPRPSGLRALGRRWRNRGVFRGGVWRVLARLKPYPVFGAERWFRHIEVGPSSRILDVGCGTAEIVRDLAEAGFTAVQGIDPYLPDQLLRELSPFARRAHLHEVSGQYDVVMLHHVLEHIGDQDAALRHVARLLTPSGVCLIRIPVMGGEAWERYRENWVQLDAPRHYFLHSPASLRIVAERAGLTVERVEYDSTEFQFLGSELYERDISLSELSLAGSAAKRREHVRRARRLNLEGRGDQASFYLRLSP